MPQGVDIRIASTASHNGQHQRAKYIPDLWCVRAAVLQRTGRDEWIEQSGLFQEVDDKRQLTKRSDGFFRRSANIIPAPETIQCHRLI